MLQPRYRAAHPIFMTYAALCLATALLAASSGAQVDAQNTGRTSQSAAAELRAQMPVAPNPGAAPQAARGKAHHARTAQSGNSKVEVIGANNAAASIDHPLLPIASIGNNLGIRSGTPIKVQLKQAVDSGHVHNGDTLDATLAQPLAKLPAGTPVKLTVVEASPAGALLSYGELSLQVVSIGNDSVLSEIVSVQGKEGRKEQADSAPLKGTEASFSAGQVLSLPAA